jgi:hypothetical protein
MIEFETRSESESCIPRLAKILRFSRNTITGAVLLLTVLSSQKNQIAAQNDQQVLDDQVPKPERLYDGQNFLPDQQEVNIFDITPIHTITQVESQSTKPELKLTCFAKRLVIPKIGIDQEVQLTTFNESRNTWETPDIGIATPLLDSRSQYKPGDFWIFGHSRYRGKAQTFFHLDELDIGDEIQIDVIPQITCPEQLKFKVKKIILSDELFYPDGKTILLQTSAKPSENRKEGWSNHWILNKEKILAKAEVIIRGKSNNPNLDDPTDYFNLYVVGEQVEE